MNKLAIRKTSCICRWLWLMSLVNIFILYGRYNIIITCENLRYLPIIIRQIHPQTHFVLFCCFRWNFHLQFITKYSRTLMLLMFVHLHQEITQNKKLYLQSSLNIVELKVNDVINFVPFISIIIGEGLFQHQSFLRMNYVKLLSTKEDSNSCVQVYLQDKTEIIFSPLNVSQRERSFKNAFRLASSQWK